MSVLFNPVRGTEASIAKRPITEGNVYYAIDSGKMYVDTNKQRIAMGAAGAAIYYGTATDLKIDELTQTYSIGSDFVEGTPKVGDLILNSDGGFYKVGRVGESTYVCTLLSISGTGGGSVVTQTRPKVTRWAVANTTLINGSTAYVDLEAESLFVDGVPIDDTLRIQVSLGTKTNVDSEVLKSYWTTTLTYRTYEDGYEEKYGVGLGKVKDRIEFGSKLRDSTTSYLVVQVTAGTHDLPSLTKGLYDPITTSVLELKQISSYNPSNIYSSNGFNLSYNVNGAIDKKIKFTFDGVTIKPKGTGSNTDISPYSQAVWTPSFDIPAAQYTTDENGDTIPVLGTATHGFHTVEVQLCQLINDEEGEFVTPLKYELCVAENDSTKPPIIWLGDYQSIYYTYDTIQIPYFVYDPANKDGVVLIHLYKNEIELDSSPREIDTSDTDSWNLWEIVDADFKQLNKYQISCGEDKNRQTWREIRFTVEEDESRKDFVIEASDLMLNFAATGRTNSESAAKRATWSYDLNQETKYATFTNFNWRNNGWIMDSDLNTACLRISNGATLSIPYQTMIFGSSTAEQQSHSVELQFKISNAQKYDKLITNLTRYKYKENEEDTTYKYDTEWYTAFTDPNQTDYDNYDAYLQATLAPDIYDKLEFHKVEKIINTKNIIGGLYDINESTGAVTGFCIGTQDAFFSNGVDTVNVDFVENDLVNLSFVYQHGLKNLYIYINGCITGVIKSSISDGNTFVINSGNFIFNSNSCDIDLYKLRIYKKNLGVNHIVKNFAVDRKDIDIFDMINLATENTTLQEYQVQYSNVMDFIANNPDRPLMPYIVFDTGNIDSRLPYSKKDKKNISVEFVNVPLEQAYKDGRLEDLASADGLYNPNTASAEQIEEAVKTYYKHHCPSFTSSIRANDKVGFEVQGTSSEFYPRRNYKIKTKVEGNFNWKPIEDFSDEDKAELKAEELEKLETDGGLYMEEESLNMFMNRGPFETAFAEDQAAVEADLKNLGYETTRLVDGWYMDNYTNATDRWTLKVDYMESSGSYNAGFASWVGNSYTKHPLQDYLDVLTNTDKLLPIVDTDICDDDGMRWEDYRTSLLGFPIMAFWKRGTDGVDAVYTFIGYYRMLLDKSSTSVLGFKTPKKVCHKLFPDGVDDDGKQQYKRLRDVAECWEFSNNARGFCSYRDPWNRVEMSFKAPAGVANEYTSNGAPIVANSFEYRYHSKDDYIDVLYDFDEASQDDLDEVIKELGLAEGSITAGDRESGADALLTTHANWEKVCKWLWSTNLDAVSSQGTYKEVPVGDVLFDNSEETEIFVINDDGIYIKVTGLTFDKTKEYYTYKKNDSGNIEYETDSDGNQILDDEGNPVPLYAVVDVTTNEYLYTPGKFYYQTQGLDTTDTADDVYAIADDETYDGSLKYYIFTDDPTTFDERFDLLVRPVDTENEAFDPAGEYFTWHGTEVTITTEDKPTGAVQEVSAPTEEDWQAGLYYVRDNSVVYAGKQYTHDTKEYRIAKFTNEFEKHFDPEYVATYFIMTEVMECYDSRGKNCMMASWGPQEEGGEYIWYPIFYDIDTQLGINNTGIPSFTYNVDATEENNFSTSDSILWNNFYRFFKTTWMLPKYQNLRQISTKKFDPLLERDKTTSKAPLQSVDYIEKWYNFNPKTNHMIACEGAKPLIATNLDMYFKYITITNAKAKDQGVAHLDDSGNYAEPDSGTYFYALQGDRSQSRRQFLTNRLEYIDSWLTQGNYARGGANRLWGRISANNMDGSVHSDTYLEDDTHPYWVDGEEFGTKSNEFDAEYWLELKPIRSSYVTAGDDSANYPSQKYDGVNQLYFTLNELENGIRKSANYPEQLLYIYGTNQMSDFGDLSKMYWTEFKIEGSADRLTRLKLGHDGLDVNNKSWYNNKLNAITIPKLPLLKEANFSNINITGDNRSLNLENSEKLENFRATGSNISSISFAEGVSLNTLYLPSTVASLSLKGASQLTDLIQTYEHPTKDANGNLVATKGLFIEGLFDNNASSQFVSLELDDCALGYNSYTLIKKLYDKGIANITLKNVQWCPYTALTEGDIFNLDKTYYKDNGHYGFELYTAINAVASDDTFSEDCDYYTFSSGVYSPIAVTSSNFASLVTAGLYAFNRKQFNADILSGILYCDEGFGGREDDGSFSDLITTVNEDAVTMLTQFVANDKFTSANGTGNPNITGIIYVNNTTTAYGEDQIVALQTNYPNLTFFFKNVNKAYSAKFVIFNPDDYSETYVKWLNGSTSPSVQKIQSYSDSVYFTDPFTLYKPLKTHYDFKGWSLDDRNPYDSDGNLLSSVITDSDTWAGQKLQEDKYDYTYYAIFEIHSYELNFYNDSGTLIETVVEVPYGQMAKTPDTIPYKDDSQLSLYETYNFKGYSSSVGGELIDVSTILVTSDEDFYAVFEKVDDVRTIIHPEYFEPTDVWTYSESGFNIGSSYSTTGVSLTPKVTLKGKITIPRTFDGQPVIGIGGFGNSSGESAHAITHVFMETAEDDTKAPLTVISNSAFRNVYSLIYFDFGNSNIRQVQSYGFSSCALDADLIDLRLAPLQYVQNAGFAQGITSSKATTLFIPACLKIVGNTGFANLRMASGSTMEIGSDADKSLLDLSLNSTIYGYSKFTQGSYPFTTVYFYSDKYDDKLEVILSSNDTEITVEDFFVDYYDDVVDLIVY